MFHKKKPAMGEWERACDCSGCALWCDYSGRCAFATVADILADSTICQTGYSRKEVAE